MSNEHPTSSGKEKTPFEKAVADNLILLETHLMKAMNTISGQETACHGVLNNRDGRIIRITNDVYLPVEPVTSRFIIGLQVGISLNPPGSGCAIEGFSVNTDVVTQQARRVVKQTMREWNKRYAEFREIKID